MSKENEVSQQTGISNLLFELFGTSLTSSFFYFIFNSRYNSLHLESKDIINLLYEGVKIVNSFNIFFFDSLEIFYYFRINVSIYLNAPKSQ